MEHLEDSPKETMPEKSDSNVQETEKPEKDTGEPQQSSHSNPENNRENSSNKHTDLDSDSLDKEANTSSAPSTASESNPPQSAESAVPNTAPDNSNDSKATTTTSSTETVLVDTPSKRQPRLFDPGRGKRMFGMLMGTLLKAKEDQKKNKDVVCVIFAIFSLFLFLSDDVETVLSLSHQETRRKAIEAEAQSKIEPTIIPEKPRQSSLEDVQKELIMYEHRQEVVGDTLRKYDAQLLELKWELQRHIEKKFRVTKTNPPIFYRPNDRTMRKLERRGEFSDKQNQKTFLDRLRLLPQLSHDEVAMLGYDEGMQIANERMKSKEQASEVSTQVETETKEVEDVKNEDKEEIEEKEIEDVEPEGEDEEVEEKKTDEKEEKHEGAEDLDYGTD